MEDQITVDMLSVCCADGKLQPLRFRFVDENCEIRLVKILEILSCKEVRYIQAEAYAFSCRARIEDRETVLTIRYFIRTHRWCLQGRVY